MLLSTLAVLLSLPTTQPVRLTLDPATVVPGDRVRVFVDVASAGHLLVLRVAPDGRVAVVFPADPAEGTFIDAGGYEIRPPGEPTAFTALATPGNGVVVAALAQAPYEFDEFVREGSWSPVALAAAGTHTDATGTLLDIVQRMLGPEYFNYDVAVYSVAPAAAATPVTTASYGFGSCWTYGCAWGGWYLPWALQPCLYSWFGCGIGPGLCREFVSWRWCEESCWTVRDCRPKARSKAVARYRRGVPTYASAAPRPPTAPSEPTPYRLLERSSAKSPAAFTGASRAAPLSSGKKASTPAARPRLPRRTDRAVPAGSAKEAAPLPERVPWPTSVIARGKKTPPPAERPREARLKQSAARPPLPTRVAWPTAKRQTSRPPTGLAPAGASPGKVALPSSIRRGPTVPLGFPRSTSVAKVWAGTRNLFPAAMRGSAGRGGKSGAAAGGSRALAPATARAGSNVLGTPARSK